MIAPELSPISLHIWTAQVDQLAHQRQEFEGVISNDEQTRAARFLSDDVRVRFIVARGVLRSVLGRYLGISPGEVQFGYGERGKPILLHSDLRFNLSHSENVILLGVTRGREVGVDVEHIHPVREMTTIARDNFSAQEQAALFALPEDQRELAFFTCWTRKEAYIKAVGDGFALPLADFDVTLAPGDVPRLLRAKGDDPERWTLYHLEPAEGYVGAVCVERGDLMVSYHNFTTG